MKQAKVNIGGIQLFYAERNEAAEKSIFFFHGNSSSHKTWQYQFQNQLLNDYRLIAFDLPAHGLSDEAAEATDKYSLPGIAKIMVQAILKLANNKPFILAGVSLGTNIIAEMPEPAIEPSGLVLAGPCITGHDRRFDQISIPGTMAGLGFVDECSEQDLLILDKELINVHGQEKTNLFTRD